MVSTACSYTGMPGGVPGVELRPMETLLWTSTGAGLVRARFRPAWRRATYASFTGDLLGMSQRPGDAEDPGDDGESAAARASAEATALTVLARGTVAVTDERVLFLPSAPEAARQEWAYETMRGLASPTGHPCTLFRGGETEEPEVEAPIVPTGSGAAAGARERWARGVLVRAEAAHEFRFVLSLALADHEGDRAGFVEHLQRLLDTQAQAEPVPPASVTAADAAHPARLFLRNARRPARVVPAQRGRAASRGAAARALRPVGVAMAMFGMVVLAAWSGPAVGLAARPAPGPSLDPSFAEGRPVVGPVTPAPAAPDADETPAPQGARSDAERPRPQSPSEDDVSDGPGSDRSGSRPERTGAAADERSPAARPRVGGRYPEHWGGGWFGGAVPSGWWCGTSSNPYGFQACGTPFTGDSSTGACRRHGRCAGDESRGRLLLCSDRRSSRPRSTCRPRGEHGPFSQGHAEWDRWKDGGGDAHRSDGGRSDGGRDGGGRSGDHPSGGHASGIHASGVRASGGPGYDDRGGGEWYGGWSEDGDRSGW